MTAKRILVIDDEADILRLIQTCLEIMRGWQVLTADSGSEGLRLAEAHRPDAILLDVMMPDMDGVTTFQNLQANPATECIPVIFLTAKGRYIERNMFAELGIKGVLNKPFNPLKIADQIAATLS